MPGDKPGHGLRGTSVRRVVGGLTVYAADYYDTARPDVQSGLEAQEQ